VLNPLAERKVEPGSYEFLYRQSASECEGEGGLTTALTAAVGAKGEAVSVPVSELLPHTTYSFCLRAVDEAGEAATSAPVSFTTLAAAPSVQEVGVTRVTSESATLIAKIDPGGATTTFAFEYGPEGGAFVPVPGSEGKGSLPEGASGVSVSAHVQSLLTHSGYRFRVTAVNAVEAVTSSLVSFTTQTAGSSFALPDGREWEMVSPPHKEGALFLPIGEGLIQAAADGNAFEGESWLSPIEARASGVYGFYEANFFGRGPDGWVSQTINPPHSGFGEAPIGNGQEYRFFSADLSKGILQPFGPATPLTAGVSQSTPYLRTDYLNGDQGELCDSGSGCYLPLVNDGNVPPGTQYGGEQNGPCRAVYCGPEVLAVTPDLSHVLISSPLALTEDTKSELVNNMIPPNIYEWSDGRLEFVGAGELAFRDLGIVPYRHVISRDGSRVFIEGSYKGVSGLLMRDVVTGETVKIAPGVFTGSTTEFVGASSDGSRVFLYNDDFEPELFEYNLNAPTGNRMTDLSVDLNPGERPGAAAMLGASEDGSYVYFAATGVLAPGATPASSCSGAQPCMNLYLRHEGVTKFIVGLGGKDSPDWGNAATTTPNVRVSPNGQWLEFMSNRDLVGYDTSDAVTGQPDEEVYLYGASANKLVCASCDPTGARPNGVEVNFSTTNLHVVAGVGVGVSGFSEGTRIAANVPPYTRFTGSGAGYQSRYLSDSGRLFFNSDDALVPQDVNGGEDVYEYEPAGVGNCSASLTTFDPKSGGCVSLISSGESSEESGFLDASESGGDVFFLTASKLVRRDFDNQLDVYDARECGSDGSRCIAAEPASPPPCGTSDSCKAAPSPQPAIFGSPASATFNGSGDVVAPVSASVVKAKRLTAAQLLARALRRCRGKKGEARRVCERVARGRYGEKRSRKANAIKGRGR
jgi:hypothetical protein